ncbi:DUF7268 family protein [Halorussus aquaticus]|uniref:Uncharacterized protein n=1 Tax=Halorussus aquaticus TaxID=2953748 RepID=A0ABD5Q2M0_9EURY|nr:hypothetical protein [Halorussus aquaticus]
MSSAEPSDGDSSSGLRERAREVWRAALLGAALGAFGLVAVVVAGETLQFASEKLFALAALVFGFSLLGWSGSMFAGRGMENFQKHLGGRSDWSAADSRQAMAVLGGVGVGGMVGVSVGTAVLANVV